MIFELASVIIAAALLGMLMRALKQPILLAYLLAGILLSALGFGQIAQHETFALFSDLGIMLLLFLVGLEINYTSVRMVGKIAVLLGLGQIVFTFLIGYLIALLFHFPPLAAAYISIALTFSSTIIVVKLLSEKQELHSLYGKISVGFLLVQDFVAIVLLVMLGGIAEGGVVAPLAIAAAVVKGIGLFAVMIWLGRRMIPHLLDRLNRSPELLFLISLAWLFLVAAVVSRLGFSIEIAGFLAGIALANSYENFQIASHLRPLRDFFLMIFFVILGASVVTFHFAGLGWPLLIFSLFVLVGNPLIVLVLMGLMGYRRRTSFMTGVTMAQISEFSLILAALGLKLGHISRSIVGLITTVGIITIVLSTYLIVHGDRIVHWLWKFLAIFERVHPMKEDGLSTGELKKPFILVGAQRIGHIIASHLPKDQLLIIDFDPSVVARFRRHGYTVLLGDVADRDVIDAAHFEEAKLVICTSPSLEDNVTLLTALRPLPGRRRLILRADNDRDSALLYKRGADYVIRPHLTAGHYIGEILAENLIKGDHLWRAREKDYKIMKKEIWN